MNISKEDINDLNAVIRIRFSPEDYQPKIDQELKEYGKKVNMPGFRPGKVPAGMVKKMYGKSILVDQLNKLTSDSLYTFIRDNQLDILGNPLPKAENDTTLNLDNPGEIDFAFDVALAPAFSLDLTSAHSFKLYIPESDNAAIDETVADYRSRYSTRVDKDVPSKESFIDAHIDFELNGDVKHVDRTFSPADLSPEGETVFFGLAVDASVSTDPKVFFKDQQTLLRFLGVTEEEVDLLPSEVTVQVEGIYVQEPAALGQEFYDNLFGKDVIFTEQEMRNRISTDFAKEYRKNSEMRFYNEVVEHLISATHFNLPDEFLKRWLVSANEGKINPSDIESNYENYAKGIRWQLIENKLLKENNIVVSQEEALDSLTDDFLNYMGAGQNADETMRARAKEIAANMLKNEKETNRIFERLYRDKMITLFLSSFTIVEEGLSFEAWKAKMNEPVGDSKV